MGATCIRTKKGMKKSTLDIVERVDISLLKLIYMDLSQRSQNRSLSKQDFKIFFHLNGLWSQQLFRKFDKNQNKIIESGQFLETITHLVELPFEEKINQFFGIYDLEGHGVISYQTFVKMLFSYPIDELKIILEDQEFKNSFGKLEQSYYFNIENLMNLGENYNIQLEKSQPRRSKSMEIEGIDKQSIQQENNQKVMSNSTKLQRQMKKKSEKKKIKFLSQLNSDQQISLKKMSSQKIHFEEQQIDVSNLALTKCFSDPKATKYKIHIKKCKVVSSLTLMVKKYARYLFDLHSQNGDLLTKQAFRNIVNQHPQIINPFEQGFHSYIWRLDQNKKPKYISEKIKYQSQCEIVQDDEHFPGYMKFLRNTIMIFHKKSDIIPIQIKCLEGLNVKAIQNSDSAKNQFGIIFKHKDGIYPQRKYLFKDKNLLSNWIKVLQEYTCNTILNRYELKQIIGSGNFSKVWRAIEKQSSSPISDTKSNSSRICEQNSKCVAIKIIEKSKVQQSAYQAIKFQCQLLNLIHHPYIIKMVAKQQTKSSLLIITEYCSQGSLFQYCQEKQYLDEYEAAIIVKQLLEGLCYLSELGIIHRDLKPENIMVVYDGKKRLVRKIKIIDFGLATYLENLKEVEQDKIAKGTPGFVPPEAFLAKTYYENSDLFSVGIILYEMLSGQLPFQGNSIQEILLKTVQCNLKFKDSKSKQFSWSKISQDVKDFLTKIITFPEQRLSIDEALNHKWLQNIEKLKPQGKYQ